MLSLVSLAVAPVMACLICRGLPVLVGSTVEGRMRVKCGCWIGSHKAASMATIAPASSI